MRAVHRRRGGGSTGGRAAHSGRYLHAARRAGNSVRRGYSRPVSADLPTPALGHDHGRGGERSRGGEDSADRRAWPGGGPLSVCALRGGGDWTDGTGSSGLLRAALRRRASGRHAPLLRPAELDDREMERADADGDANEDWKRLGASTRLAATTQHSTSHPHPCHCYVCLNCPHHFFTHTHPCPCSACRCCSQCNYSHTPLCPRTRPWHARVCCTRRRCS